MFQEIIKGINVDVKLTQLSKLEEDVESTTLVSTLEMLYKKAASIRADIIDEILRVQNWKNDLLKLNLDFAAASKAVEIVRDRKVHQNILEKNIYIAVQTNAEFAQQMYLDRLIGVAQLEDLYNMFPLEQGGVEVSLNMNAVAGNLDEYARAVTLVRTEIQRESTKAKPRAFAGRLADAGLRSHFWAEKFYGVAVEGRVIKTSHGKERPDKTEAYRKKYFDTIKRRLAACSHPAPFWELLDKGSIKMSSDIGGKPYPINVATNFVYNTVIELESHVNHTARLERRVLLAKRDKALNSAEQYKEELEALRSKLSDIINNILDYMERYRRIIETPTQTRTEEIIKVTETVIEKYKKTGDRYSEVVAVRALSSIINDVKLETKTRGRIYKGGKTYYTRQLLNELYKKLEEANLAWK